MKKSVSRSAQRRNNPCYDLTRLPENGRKRCPQCWKVKTYPKEFIGKSGGVVQLCSSCSEKRATYLKRWRGTLL